MYISVNAQTAKNSDEFPFSSTGESVFSTCSLESSC